jgi:citrate synthase
METVRIGLQGVIAAETRLSMVDGERGELIIAGRPVEELAGASFESVVDLLWGSPAPPLPHGGAASRRRRERRRDNGCPAHGGGNSARHG